ncbi:MAG: GNAT family N-acetyltransferase [Chromatiales bacterium]
MKLKWSASAEQDLPALLSLMAAFAAGEGRPFDRARCQRNVLYLLTRPAFGGIWLIHADAYCVGYVAVTLGYSFEFGGHDSFVDELYVLPEFRGKGIGTRTMSFAERAARALGARWLHLEASKRKPGLNAFYARNGYIDRGYYLLSKPLPREADAGGVKGIGWPSSD